MKITHYYPQKLRSILLVSLIFMVTIPTQSNAQFSTILQKEDIESSTMSTQIATGKYTFEHQLSTHEEDAPFHLSNILITPDGKKLIHYGLQGSKPSYFLSKIHIWNLETYQLEHTLSIVHEVVAVTPDSQYLITGGSDGERNVSIFDLNTGKIVRKTATNAYLISLNNLAVSPDGKMLLTRGDVHNIQVWNLATGKLLKAFKLNDDIEEIINQYIITESADGTVKIWNWITGNLEQSISSDGTDKVIISDDGNYVIKSEKYALEIWNLKTGNLRRFFNRELTNDVYRSGVIRMSPNGQYLMSRNSDNPRLVNIWNLKTEQLAQILDSSQQINTNSDDQSLNDNEIKDILVSPLGHILITSYYSLDINIWKPQ